MTALASEHITFWWLTLGLGVVVASAVILLLQLLVTFVKDIDGSVSAAWEQAGGVATQTYALSMLNDTLRMAEALRDETGRHADAISALNAGSGSRHSVQARSRHSVQARSRA